MKSIACLAALAASALCFAATPHNQAWTVQYRPNTLMGVVNFLAPDYYSNLYAVAKRSDGGSTMNILDRTGHFLDDLDTQAIIDQGLDGQSSTLYYLQQNNGQTELNNHYLFSGGFGWPISSNNNPIAAGIDKFGVPIVVSSDSSTGTLRVFRSGPDTGVMNEWDNTSVVAEKAVVTRDYVFVIGSDAQNLSNKMALLYDPIGNLLWSRTFTNIFAFNRFFTIVGFCEDSTQNTYLAVNETTGNPAVKTFTIRYIEPLFGNQDQWVYTANGSTSLIAAQNPNHVYYAFDNGGRRLGMLNAGTSQWNFSVPVSSMSCPNDNSGAVMVAYYNDAVPCITLAKYDSTPSLQYQYSFPANTPSDIGPITWDRFHPTVYFGGGTTAGGGNAFITKIVEGDVLQSVSMPSNVIGGNSLAGTFAVTGLPTNPLSVEFIPASTTVAKGTFSVQNSLQGSFSLATVGVDGPTPVKIDAVDGWGVVVHSSTKVMPAAIGTFQLGSTTVQGGQPVSFSLQYNGKTGPAGKAITVSSGDSSIIPLQGPFYVPPQTTSASGLQFLTNKVTATKSITVLVSDGYSHRSATVTVTP